VHPLQVVTPSRKVLSRPSSSVAVKAVLPSCRHYLRPDNCVITYFFFLFIFCLHFRGVGTLLLAGWCRGAILILIADTKSLHIQDDHVRHQSPFGLFKIDANVLIAGTRSRDGNLPPLKHPPPPNPTTTSHPLPSTQRLPFNNPQNSFLTPHSCTRLPASTKTL
jgi:hypothetical protein